MNLTLAHLQLPVDVNGGMPIINAEIEPSTSRSGHKPVPVAELIDRITKAQRHMLLMQAAIDGTLELINATIKDAE